MSGSGQNREEPVIEPFVDALQGAEFLAIRPRRLLEMARAGDIPAHPIGGGRRRTWRFRLSELADSVATNERENAAGKRGMINPGGSLAVPRGKGH